MHMAGLLDDQSAVTMHKTRLILHKNDGKIACVLEMEKLLLTIKDIKVSQICS